MSKISCYSLFFLNLLCFSLFLELTLCLMIALILVWLIFVFMSRKSTHSFKLSETKKFSNTIPFTIIGLLWQESSIIIAVSLWLELSVDSGSLSDSEEYPLWLILSDCNGEYFRFYTDGIITSKLKSVGSFIGHFWMWSWIPEFILDTSSIG